MSCRPATWFDWKRNGTPGIYLSRRGATSLAFSYDISIRGTKNYSAWFLKLRKELNKIEGSLHEERNRMIHDKWHPGSGKVGVTRTYKRPKLVKENGRETLHVGIRKTMGADDIWNFIEKVAICNSGIANCISDLARFQEEDALPFRQNRSR